MPAEEMPVNTTPDFRTANGYRSTGTVRVSAPGRLHLGYLDLAGTLGRRFGSLGIALDEPATVIQMRRARGLSATGPYAGRAIEAAEKVARYLGVDTAIEITVETALPSHVGLGSGTQLDLSVAIGLCRLNDLDLATPELALAVGRDGRSAVGVGAFAQGGVILDGGRKHGGNGVPPILARLPFPAEWRVLLVHDGSRQGRSDEAQDFTLDDLPPFADTLAGHLTRLAVMVALPALADGDVDYFAAAIGEMQRLQGEHYAGTQGERYVSAGVAQVMDWLEACGLRGLGQSSWGPTGFAILGTQEHADRILEDARHRFADRPELTFQCVRGRNSGAVVEYAQ